MVITSIEPFLDYYGRLRSRTDRVAACIPPEHLEWAPVPGSFSFGDVLRHLAASERYAFTENALGRPSRYPGHARDLADGHAAVMDYFDRMHHESVDLLAGLSPEDLAGRCLTTAGTSIPVWKWLRALAEHEVHHRGQLYLMLRILGVSSPPLFGLTSEEVRAGSTDRAGPAGS